MRKRDGYEYHVQIRGKSFQEKGNSVENARELAAESALKDFGKFKSEHISWPEKLLPFRLNQNFADEIGKMVKIKYDEIMERSLQYKAHRVRAAIVMTTQEMSFENAKVIAIETGTKCISISNEDQLGIVLHDMHAEVLARRSFVRYIYSEINAMLKKKSSIFEWDGKEIRLKEGVKFHLYVNAIPCGDARVFSLKGLEHVKKEAKMGSLRIKQIGSTEPISVNTNRTTSMSCSDKLARWNVLGLQGCNLAKYIKPIYLESIVLGSVYSPTHLHRAIAGRLSDNRLSHLPNHYYLNSPKFESTSVMETDNSTSCASINYGIAWCDVAGDGSPEILDLHTGLSITGRRSLLSKFSFMESFQKLNEKLPVRSADGIFQFRTAKKQFFNALQNENLGAWEKCYI